MSIWRNPSLRGRDRTPEHAKDILTGRGEGEPNGRTRRLWLYDLGDAMRHQLQRDGDRQSQQTQESGERATKIVWKLLEVKIDN